MFLPLLSFPTPNHIPPFPDNKQGSLPLAKWVRHWFRTTDYVLWSKSNTHKHSVLRGLSKSDISTEEYLEQYFDMEIDKVYKGVDQGRN